MISCWRKWRPSAREGNRTIILSVKIMHVQYSGIRARLPRVDGKV